MYFNHIKKYKGRSHSKKLKKTIKNLLFIFLTNTSLYFVVRKCLKTTMKKKEDKFMLCSQKNIKKLPRKKIVLLVEPLFETRVKITTKCDLKKTRTL